jgi:hypothetical protein
MKDFTEDQPEQTPAQLTTIHRSQQQARLALRGFITIIFDQSPCAIYQFIMELLNYP